MAQTALGLLLQHLREKRGLKLRELGQLSEVDHAYIYRLEVGDKEAPSDEVLTKLIRGLKPGKRETAMLRFLVEHTDTLPEFVNLAIEDDTITEEIFAAAAATAYRGSGRPDARKAIERVRRILEEENGSH